MSFVKHIDSFITEVIRLMFNKANLLKFICGVVWKHAIVVIPNVGVTLFYIDQSFIRASSEYYHRLTH